MENSIQLGADVYCGWQGRVETAPELDCILRKPEELGEVALLRWSGSTGGATCFRTARSRRSGSLLLRRKQNAAE